ncbi:MAG TPA: discoidin domain-containing protein, partial [Paludibacteraceae bacterium]|nr:discoidin domain-containing protein [Paludibacteraceae bacterium]
RERQSTGVFDTWANFAMPTYMGSASWDWMPYVPGLNCGITGNVYLSTTGMVKLDDVWVRSDLPDDSHANLSIQATINNTCNQSVTGILNGTIMPGNIHFSKTVVIEANQSLLVKINQEEYAQLIINNPLLWWPIGYGNQNLYTLSLEFKVNNEVSDAQAVIFGIRKYEYKNENGAFTFYVNHSKVFVRGGNWGVSEYLLRCKGEDYDTRLKLHADMNFNMIRCWTGCVTDDEFYDYCDKYGIMVWDDFWLYVAFNDVAQPEAFKANALDKVRRLRNHPCIAVWCGANETHPKPELDNYLREMIAKEDNNDRLYKSCSNQDGLSGSGWWGNQPPKHHFETSGSNLAWNDPPYPYGSDYGYGFRSEIGTATFPVYESIIKFMPQDQLWPLPTDEQLRNDDNTIYNKHFFGKEASNANPVNYKRSVNTEFGESANLQEFCEKAQLLNIEVMKGMYEAWNDKMWNDASGLLIWMSQSAYPSFVWQTYDYYYDATGSYWGAKKACEPQHIQWNCSSNSVKVINTTSKALTNVKAMVNVYDINGKEIGKYRKSAVLNVNPSNINEAFVINFNTSNLALGKKAFASSSTKNMDAALITDGASGSRWESEYNDPQWIYVDLGKKQKIESVVLKWEAAHAKEYELQVSNDANNWTTIYKQQDSKGGTETIKIKPVSAQFVKLNCISRATIFGYSLF